MRSRSDFRHGNGNVTDYSYSATTDELGLVQNYDGNFTELRGSTVPAANSDDQLTSTGYGYDGNGNPTDYDGNALTYDPENRLTDYAVSGTSTMGAGYGYDGLRAWRTDSSGAQEFYLYDGMDPVVQYSSDGVVAVVNTFGANGLLSRFSQNFAPSGDDERFYAFDPQGNTAEMLASTGSGAARLLSATYDAFGAIQAYPTTYAADAYANFGAQWAYFADSGENLKLLGHRYYDEANGRFVNRDPLGNAVSHDLYAFAGDSVPRRGDPYGLMSIIVGDPNYPIFCFGSCTDPGHPTLVLNYNGASPFYNCIARNIKEALWPPYSTAAGGLYACRTWRPGGAGGGGKWGVGWPGWSKVGKGAAAGASMSNGDIFMIYVDLVLIYGDLYCGITTYNQMGGVGEQEAL